MVAGKGKPVPVSVRGRRREVGDAHRLECSDELPLFGFGILKSELLGEPGEHWEKRFVDILPSVKDRGSGGMRVRNVEQVFRRLDIVS